MCTINYTIKLICVMYISKARYKTGGKNLLHLGKYTLSLGKNTTALCSQWAAKRKHPFRLLTSS